MFFLFLLIILSLILVAIYTCRLEIEIENFEINTEKKNGEKISSDSKIYVYLIIFGKFKIFKKNIINLIKNNMKFQNKDLDINFFKNKNFKINYKELLQIIDIDLRKIDLNLEIGTEDAAFTAILSGIISAILGVFLRKPKFKVVPIFLNKNFIKLKLNCIFSVKLMQYIYKLNFDKISKLIKENFNRKVEV